MMVERKALETEGLTKRFGRRTVVSGIDLAIRCGEIYGLVGPNGSGKSTLMKLLAMLIKASEGSIRYFEQPSVGPEVAGLIGFLIEHPVFYGHLTIRDNLALRATVLGIPDIGHAVSDAIEAAGLASFSDEKAQYCSVGMRQRLGLGLAIVGRPRILLLDEPFGGIDIPSVSAFSQWLSDYAKVEGAAVLITTHVVSQIGSLADRFGIMAGGRLAREMTGGQVAAERRGELVVECDAPERAVAVLNDRLGLRASVGSDGRVCLNKETAAGDVSAVLTRSDVVIRSIRTEQEGLDDLFARLIGSASGCAERAV